MGPMVEPRDSRRAMNPLRLNLPTSGRYGVGMARFSHLSICYVGEAILFTMVCPHRYTYGWRDKNSYRELLHWRNNSLYPDLPTSSSYSWCGKNPPHPDLPTSGGVLPTSQKMQSRSAYIGQDQDLTSNGLLLRQARYAPDLSISCKVSIYSHRTRSWSTHIGWALLHHIGYPLDLSISGRYGVGIASSWFVTSGRLGRCRLIYLLICHFGKLLSFPDLPMLRNIGGKIFFYLISISH